MSSKLSIFEKENPGSNKDEKVPDQILSLGPEGDELRLKLVDFGKHEESHNLEVSHLKPAEASTPSLQDLSELIWTLDTFDESIVSSMMRTIEQSFSNHELRRKAVDILFRMKSYNEDREDSPDKEDVRDRIDTFLLTCETMYNVPALINYRYFFAVPFEEYTQSLLGEKLDESQLKQLFTLSEREDFTVTFDDIYTITMEDDEGVRDGIGLCVEGTILSKEGTQEKMGVFDIEFRITEEFGFPEKYIYVHERRSFVPGLGLDIECMLDNIALKYGFSAIRNTARTLPEKNYYGGYIWTKYGYEFADQNEKNELLEKLLAYAKRENITPLHEPIEVQYPWEFAAIEGKNEQGEIVPLGVDFLSKEDCMWEGVRYIHDKSQPLSPSDEVFLKYLRKKGRDDLADERYGTLKKL